MTSKMMARKRWALATEADRERLRTLRSKPTKCLRCGLKLPTAREARAHCRKKRSNGKNRSVSLS